MSNKIAKNHNCKLLFKAPFPFLGQKKNWIKYLPLFFQQDLLNNFNLNDYIFVDMFGGSGLLSYNIKQLCPDAEVIYNDYDFYTKFFSEESLNAMENLHSDLINIAGEQKLKNEKIPVDKGEQIIKVINYYIDKYNDLINLRQLGSWLLFSAKAFEKVLDFQSHLLYNRLAKKLNRPNKDYLKGLVIEHLDFRKLYQKYSKYSTRNKKLFLICDPPYIATDSGNYKNWFRVTDFLDLMEICEKETFIMFSSNKSEFKNFVDWHIKKYKKQSAFYNTKLFKEYKSTLACKLSHSYLDQMFYLYR